MLDNRGTRRAREVIAVTAITVALLAGCCVALGAGQLVNNAHAERVDTRPVASASSFAPTLPLRRIRLAATPHVRHSHVPNAPTTTSAGQPPATTAAPLDTTPPPVLPAIPTTTAAPATTTPPPPATTPPAAPAAAGPSGQMIFDDEFASTSLDLSKWQPNWLGNGNAAITKPINGSEISCYDPGQVSVSGGYLHLDAVARSCTDNNGTKYGYASGLVNSNGHFTFTYGHMEARMCVPGSGSITDWPAFWADGTGTWPVTGELDVMEGLSGHAAGHFHSPSGGPGVNAPSSINGAGCHVYAADWSAGKVTFIYDGQTIGSITQGITSAPMYLILNLGVGGSGGAVQAPATMLVDYVRVWKT